MDEHLDKMAFAFFKLFARYEFYLKESGFFRAARSGKIIVDWDRFVNDKIGPEFLENLGTKADSAKYILQSPPMKQVVDTEGVIVWEEVSKQEKSVQALFGHISRIRNNLYHGAKFNGTWFDPQRSENLLKHGLVVLEHFQGIANIE